MIQHVLWDWNGTLLNDTRIVWELGNMQLREAGLREISLDEFQREFGHPVIEYYHRIGLKVSAEEFSVMSVHFHEVYRERLSQAALHANAEEVLRTIQRIPVPQSILSAYPQRFLTGVVERFELHSFFESVVGLPNQLGISKVQAGRDWCAERGYGEGEVVMIGDTDHDFEVAQALGAKCLLIANGFQSLERLTGCGVEVLRSIEEVPEALRLLGVHVESRTETQTV